jgi:hypothetical protein
VSDPEAIAAINSVDPNLEVFFAAAWELCRRGVLRPSARTFGQQASAHWHGGDGYSITPYGRRWVKAADEVDLVPMQPGRFAAMLARGADKFGSGFAERADQAVGSYNGHAFLACCVMCGAAAESILLALAIAKKRDERAIFEMYTSANGRSRVERFLLGDQPTPVREEFSPLHNAAQTLAG